MKTRVGFVSNSSSSSFCIYGWTANTWEECKQILDQLRRYQNKFADKYEITYSNHQGCFDGEYVVGIGNTNSEFDHYMDDWEEYECNSPSEQSMKTLDEISKKLKFSMPDMYRDTWFDG